MAGNIKFKRGTAARWIELNPILQQGEPGFEYDTGKMKIGDGVTAWKDLEYTGKDIHAVNEFSELPTVGKSDYIYKVSNDKALYQWNPTELKYESLTSGTSFTPSDINLINGGNANG